MQVDDRSSSGSEQHSVFVALDVLGDFLSRADRRMRIEEEYA